MDRTLSEVSEPSRARVLFHLDTGMRFADRHCSVEVVENDATFALTLRHLSELERRLCPRADGLVIVIDRAALTLDGTIQMAWEEARDLAAIVALTAGAALGEVSPILAYDATPGRQRRVFRQFCGIGRDLRIPTAIDRAKVASVLGAIIANSARAEIEDAAAHAARSAARGNGIDAFATAWLGVERMNATMQKRFALPGYRIDRVRCGESDCPGADVKMPEAAGMKHLAERTGRKSDWRKAKAARVQLQHGLDSTDALGRKVVDGELARLARDFACLAITTALELPEGTLSAAAHGLAGRFVIGGAYHSRDLPPSDGVEEPYFDALALTAELIESRSAEVRAAMRPTFGFDYEIDHFGVVGGREITGVTVG